MKILYRPGDYGTRLTYPQKAHLLMLRMMARPTRWDRAAARIRAAHSEAEAAIGKKIIPPGLAPSFTVPVRFPVGGAGTGLKVGVACHLFYDDLAEEVAGRLEAIPVPFRLVVTTDKHEKRDRILPQMGRLARAECEVRVVPNRGRDIAPKLVGCADLHRDCDVVLHIHGKKSVHAKRLHGWREHIFDRLLGDPGSVAAILGVFERHGEVGMIAPTEMPTPRPRTFGTSAFYFAALAEALGRPVDPLTEWLDHPAGSMFWVRSAALKPLDDLNLGYDDFGSELRQFDSTLAHGVEHAYYLVLDIAGYRPLVVARDGDAGAPLAAATPEAFDDQIGAALAR